MVVGPSLHSVFVLMMIAGHSCGALWCSAGLPSLHGPLVG